MTEQTFDTAEAYLRGTLAPTDRDVFEASLARDMELQAEVAELREAIRAAERAGARAQIAAARNAYQPRQARGRRLAPARVLALAASVLLIAVVLVYTVLEQRAAQPEALAAAYFEPALGLPTTLGASTQADFDEGMIDYKLGNYPAAIERWSALTATAPSDTLYYYLGVAQLAADEASAAVETLARVRTSSLARDAQWYRALGLLAAEDVDEAVSLLGQLSTDDNAYRARAQELLADLQ